MCPLKSSFLSGWFILRADSTRNQVASATNDQFMRFRFILLLSFQQKILETNWAFSGFSLQQIISSRCYNHFQRKGLTVFFRLSEPSYKSCRSKKCEDPEICDHPMSKTGSFRCWCTSHLKVWNLKIDAKGCRYSSWDADFTIFLPWDAEWRFIVIPYETPGATVTANTPIFNAC